MRRRLGVVLLVLAVVLLAAGVWYGLQGTEGSVAVTGEGSAALGLMLLDDVERVYVLAVSDQSPAHLAGVEPGDYILRVDGSPVSEATVLDELLSAGGDALELTILRQEQELTLSLPCR